MCRIVQRFWTIIISPRNDCLYNGFQTLALIQVVYRYLDFYYTGCTMIDSVSSAQAARIYRI